MGQYDKVSEQLPRADYVVLRLVRGIATLMPCASMLFLVRCGEHSHHALLAVRLHRLLYLPPVFMVIPMAMCRDEDSLGLARIGMVATLFMTGTFRIISTGCSGSSPTPDLFRRPLHALAQKSVTVNDL